MSSNRAIFVPPPGFHERLIREGDPAYWSASSGVVSVASGNVNVALATAQGPGLVGKAAYIEEVTIALDKIAYAQWQIAASSDARFAGLLKQTILGPGALTFPIKQLIRGFNTSNNGNIVLSVRNNLTGGSVDYNGVISATGWRITDDMDYDADITILVIGDSTNNGTGPSATAKMYVFLLKQYLMTLGVRARIVLKSVSGSTSADHENFRKAGFHDIAHADLVIYALGINDAGAAVSDATFTANLEGMWLWVRERYLNSKMLVLGVAPLENNTSETRAVGLRSAASSFVTTQANSRLKFIDIGAAFDRTVSSNYAASDSAGNRVHPADTGHAAIFSVLQSGWSGLNFSF